LSPIDTNMRVSVPDKTAQAYLRAIRGNAQAVALALRGAAS
jgi:hypothetical protein